MPKTVLAKLVWLGIAVLGASAIGGIAIHRGESINAIWFVVAAACTYLVAFRFYSAWICAKVLVLDETRATPAERFNNGRDFVPTNRWVVFGHHFAAIAGPGPLIGPDAGDAVRLSARHLWILVGAVLGGCVQDMVIMFCSTRRDGRSLGQMARDELGPVGGWAAMIGTMTDHDHPDRGAGSGDRQRDEAQPLGHRHRARHHPGGDADRHLHARHPARPCARRLAHRYRSTDRVRARRRLGRPQRIAARAVRLERRIRRLVRDDLRFRCGNVAGVVAFGAARLSVHVPEAGRGVPSRGLHPGVGTGHEDAGAHPVHRRHGSDLQGQPVPVRVYHHRLRRDFRLPFARVLGHDTETAAERTRHPHDRLRLDGTGILRRHHGRHRGLRARTGRTSSRSTARLVW